MVCEVACSLQVFEVVDVHPVAGNILYLGRMPVPDQAVDQVRHSQVIESIFSPELFECFQQMGLARAAGPQHPDPAPVRSAALPIASVADLLKRNLLLVHGAVIRS